MNPIEVVPVTQRCQWDGCALQIDVAVDGLKNLVAYNQHGQIDPSKPFQPFGPVPASNGYYVGLLVQRSAAPFEEVQDELVEIFRQRPASPREVFQLKNELREAADIQR